MLFLHWRSIAQYYTLICAFRKYVMISALRSAVCIDACHHHAQAIITFTCNSSFPS